MFLLLTLTDQIAQWNLVNEGGVLKLRRSWKVKTFTKGLEFFRIIADLADAEGIIFCFWSLLNFLFVFSQVALDIEYHHSMLLSHQKVNPKEVIVGW